MARWNKLKAEGTENSRAGAIWTPVPGGLKDLASPAGLRCSGTARAFKASKSPYHQARFR